MPAPVEFTVRIAALTPGFNDDPQALASEIAARLIITPSEPWSSFVNGGAQPSSNVGPYLRNGNEWLVWSDTLGTYTYATQNGAGLVDGTVTLAKIADGTPKSVFTYDAAGRPSLISGTAGQVLRLDSTGLPSFANPITGTYFRLGVGTSQDYTDNGVEVPVQFNTLRDAVGVTPDTANYRIPVTAGSLWFFTGSVQLEYINGNVAVEQHYIGIRPYQNSALGIGAIKMAPASISRDGVTVSGTYYFPIAGYVDLTVASTGPAPAVLMQVSNNGNSTRFEGFRLG